LVSIAEAAAAEIGFFFESWVNRETHYYFATDVLSQKRMFRSLDEEVAEIAQHPMAPARVGAAYRIRSFGKTNVVDELCRAIALETNLFALSQMIKSVSHLTGTFHHCLDKSSVAKWWAVNSTNYPSIYTSFLGVVNHLPTTVTEAKTLIPIVRELIAAEPDALRARCILAACYGLEGQREKAEAELAAVKSRAPDYLTQSLFRACAMLFLGDAKEVAEEMKKFEGTELMANFLRVQARFNELRNQALPERTQ